MLTCKGMKELSGAMGKFCTPIALGYSSNLTVNFRLVHLIIYAFYIKRTNIALASVTYENTSVIGHLGSKQMAAS